MLPRSRGRSNLGESLLKFFIPPCENYPDGGEVELVDSPTDRETAEEFAIPRCREWREANPELVFPIYTRPDGTKARGVNAQLAEHGPAPYCCSAYCQRCAILRALDGEAPLRPNEWMWQS